MSRASQVRALQANEVARTEHSTGMTPRCAHGQKKHYQGGRDTSLLQASKQGGFRATSGPPSARQQRSGTRRAARVCSYTLVMTHEGGA